VSKGMGSSASFLSSVVYGLLVYYY